VAGRVSGMKLIRYLYPSSSELKHAYPTEEAHDLVTQALEHREDIEGMDELRRHLMINIDSEVLDQIERGEWLLIKPEAYYFDWTQFDKSVSAQLFEHRVMELMYPPPVIEKKYGHVFLVTNSETGKPLVSRSYIATVDGEDSFHRTDSKGLAHVRAPSAKSSVSIHIMFSSPAGELDRFLEQPYE
jgi:hypothetical protein